MPAKILGISAYYHDSAACLVVGGDILAAAQEERFSRQKHDPSFPRRAIDYCLRQGGVQDARELDYVVFYDKPIVKFQRLLETYLHYAPIGIRSFLEAMPLWLRRKLKMRDLIRRELGDGGTILFAEHHESHAASAFFPSPFHRAAILTVDGVGERATAAVGRGAGNTVEILRELHFPHSLGLLYSAFTHFCGFRVNSGEYKLMGLAPYGEPRYLDLLRDEVVEVREDGSLRLHMRYFDYCAGLRMTSDRLARLLGGPARAPDSPLTSREMDLAASIQRLTEEVMLKMARFARELTGERNLVLAGGVALNCVSNGRILREEPFEGLWIQPAAGDAGGALGAALFVHHQLLGGERLVDGRRDSQKASRLGPAYSDAEIERFLKGRGIRATRCRDSAERADRVAGLLADGKVVGWFQGRMEFGPRALGSRSILADPRRADMQKTLNLKIKFRESFRPFAPAVLSEHASEYFELDRESPYMLLVCPVHRSQRLPVEDEGRGLEKLEAVRSTVPAVTHVDDSARVQTISPDGDPAFYELVKRFHERTGCPLVVNTSFNVRGEPIVCAPAEAYRCFRRTGMDALVLGSYVIEKDDLGRGRVEWELEDEAHTGDSEGTDTVAASGAERRKARVFGAGLAALMAVLAVASLFLKEPMRATVFATLAAAVALATLAAPSVWTLFYRGWMRLGHALGRLLSTTALGLVFYGVLTPVGLALRVLGRPTLDTAVRDGRVTYWLPKRQGLFTVERYEKQH